MSTPFPFDMGNEENLEIILADEENSAAPELIQEELPDGSAIFSLNSDFPEVISEEDFPPPDFYRNLAFELEDSELSALGNGVLEDIEEDRETRRQWEQSVDLAFKYQGLSIEEFTNVPFIRACGAFDSSLLTAVLRNFATYRAELFPNSGPADADVIGTPDNGLQDAANRMKLLFNHFLTQIDHDYYPDSEALLMWVIFAGCAFRKTYHDQLLNRPVSRMIKPQDLIINAHCKTILDSTRISHVTKMTKKEVLLKEIRGEFIKGTLPGGPAEEDSEEDSVLSTTVNKVFGVDKNAAENNSLYDYYESHVQLTKEDFKNIENFAEEDGDPHDLPKPYIVTISRDTRKIASIKRNWRQGDPNYTRIECFTHYYYLKGYDLYGIGLAHLLGSNAVVLTATLRQLIDAGTLKNFPGGLMARGFKLEDNNKIIGPGEFHTVETGDMPIRDGLMLMPYGEPSTVLAELRLNLKKETEMIANTAQAEVSEMGTRISEGTVLAMLEVVKEMQSTILRTLRVCLGNELRLLFNLFKENLTDEPYQFLVPGSNSYISKQDFSDRINIVPAADPNLLTSAHRLVRNEATLKIAQSAPQLHNMREIYKRVYESMNVDNIDQILPPEQQAIPLDPITENVNIMQGKPVIAGLDQDHDAHDVVHASWEQQLMGMAQQGIDVQSLLSVTQAHRKDHAAKKYFVQMQAMMGAQMPPQEMMMNVEVQNQIAVQAAQMLMQQQQEAQAQQPQPIDPNAVMLADIEQRREAAYLKQEEAKMKTETEAFKSQLKFESDKTKVDAQKEMAEAKNQTDLAIADKRVNKPPRGV
jgi:hypothetical protein